MGPRFDQHPTGKVSYVAGRVLGSEIPQGHLHPIVGRWRNRNPGILSRRSLPGRSSRQTPSARLQAVDRAPRWRVETRSVTPRLLKLAGMSRFMVFCEEGATEQAIYF